MALVYQVRRRCQSGPMDGRKRRIREGDLVMAAVGRPKVIGILGMGHMGSGVAADLKGSGFDVVTTLEGRSARTKARAEAAGARLLPGLAAVLAAADTFLSIVPADQAEPLAAEVAASLDGKPLHFVDCNSITPRRTERVRQMVEAAGAVFSDGGIIGPPPGPGKVLTRFYVSGPDCAVLEALQSPQMAMRRLGDSKTQATEMKILFAGINKGTVALHNNVLAAAEKVGLRQAIMAEFDDMRPGLMRGVRGHAPELTDKAGRWAIEMLDVADALEGLGAHGGYHRAAAEGYTRLDAALKAKGMPAGKSSADDALARVLEAWLEDPGL
ncbi:MAG: NAD(P)-binding domain-containing protein [Hyphomicrobiaceae bacterium]